MVKIMEKMTKRETFAEIITLAEDAERADIVAFCEKEIASLDAKAAKAKERQAAKKAEADTLKDLIASVLTDEFATIADITAKVAETDADATVGKVTNRLTKLVADGVAERTELSIPGKEGTKTRKVKGFRIAEAD